MNGGWSVGIGRLTLDLWRCPMTFQVGTRREEVNRWVWILGEVQLREWIWTERQADRQTYPGVHHQRSEEDQAQPSDPPVFKDPEDEEETREKTAKEQPLSGEGNQEKGVLGAREENKPRRM